VGVKSFLGIFSLQFVFSENYSHTDMAGSGSTGSVPRAGLKNTIRFAWKKDEEVRMPRDTFGRTVLMGALKLKIPEVMCLQGNTMEEAYDVTLHTEGICDAVMGRAKAAAGERPLSFFNITCLTKSNFRTINVHMYNPHVADSVIAAFLGRYCDVTSGARYVKDSLGFWNGRRQFQVLLVQDEEGFEGFLHPPAVFTLGSDRGMLFYARQPPFCKKCREYGTSRLPVVRANVVSANRGSMRQRTVRSRRSAMGVEVGNTCSATARPVGSLMPRQRQEGSKEEILWGSNWRGKTQRGRSRRDQPLQRPAQVAGPGRRCH
jgi:hypothetical protein